MKNQIHIYNYEKCKGQFTFMLLSFVLNNKDHSLLGFISEGETKYIDILFFRIKL